MSHQLPSAPRWRRRRPRPSHVHSVRLAAFLAIPLLLSLVPAPLGAAEPNTDLRAAEHLLAEGDATAAEAGFSALLKADPENARAWLGLAKALHEQRRDDEALEAMARADSLGAPAPSVAFHSARIYATRGNLEKVRSSLERLADTGVKVWGQLLATPELAALADEPSLQEALARIRPCGTAPYRRFDFWVGEWSVRDARGGPPGSSRIESLLGGCLVRETYANGSYAGTSMNFFDESDGTWHQVWMDNQGLLLRLEGGWDGESMVLSSPSSRITWTPNPDGTVRQVWEQSDDAGESWDIAFDGIYETAAGRESDSR